MFSEAGVKCSLAPLVYISPFTLYEYIYRLFSEILGLNGIDEK